MGGGDLNSKKSWHPNTMKNQERVWKAEQAAAQEKKRIVELQREKAEERDRAQLKELMVKRNTGSSDNRLSWMYDKPDKKVEQEEYLLGKSIDKNSEQSEKAEHDGIPALSRRVVGSSMVSAGSDTQVDLARKIREDPLLLIKERERAARAALLNNPLQRRKLTELLRKEQEQKKESKEIRKSQKKGNDLDNMLAAKLTALGNQKGVDLATLLNSDTSDSSSEDEKPSKNKKKRKDKKKKKSKKKKRSSSSEPESSGNKRFDDIKSGKHKKHSKNEKEYVDKPRKRKSSEVSFDESKLKKPRADTVDTRSEARYERKRYYDDTERSRDRDVSKRRSSPHDKHRSRRDESRESGRRGGLSEAARAAKLAEMAAAGAEREQERGARVAAQRAADDAPARLAHAGRRAPALPDSLQARIHSNRHYIQRDQRHMNEHFARR